MVYCSASLIVYRIRFKVPLDVFFSHWLLRRDNARDKGRRNAVSFVPDVRVLRLLYDCFMIDTIAIALLIDRSQKLIPAYSICIPQDGHHPDHSLEESFQERDHVNPCFCWRSR